MHTRSSDNRHRRLAIIGLVILLALVALPLGRWLAPHDDLVSRLIREAIWWAIGALVLLWVRRVEHLPFASIGLHGLSWRGCGWDIAATLAMIASFMFTFAVIFPVFGLSMNRAAVASVTHVALWLQTATMLRTGVGEEIVFRSYATERIEALTGNRWAAGLLSAGVFIAAHIGSWGYARLIVVALGAAILTLLYVWRRDLGSNMVAHFLADFVGFMLARLQGA